jgi:hypothetical protein
MEVPAAGTSLQTQAASVQELVKLSGFQRFSPSLKQTLKEQSMRS